jgi:hypothetical protein
MHYVNEDEEGMLVQIELSDVTQPRETANKTG